MQLKTDGRVVRLLSKRHAAEEPGIEQWFLVAIGDDAKAKEAISSAAHGTEFFDLSRQAARLSLHDDNPVHHRKHQRRDNKSQMNDHKQHELVIWNHARVHEGFE